MDSVSGGQNRFYGRQRRGKAEQSENATLAKRRPPGCVRPTAKEIIRV